MPVNRSQSKRARTNYKKTGEKAHTIDILPVQIQEEIVDMLGWSVVFFIIAIIAGILGFTGIAGAAAGIAEILFVIFLILFVVFLIMGRRRPPV
jgi:uncharacterized membrane protein YtjA (UPF0391 family)